MALAARSYKVVPAKRDPAKRDSMSPALKIWMRKYEDKERQIAYSEIRMLLRKALIFIMMIINSKVQKRHSICLL